MDPRVHRRPRRLAELGRPRPRRAPSGPNRHRRRPLLRDGPRQALGPNRQGFRRHRPRRRRPGVRPRRKKCNEATTRASRTSSSSPSSLEGRPRLGPDDTRDLLQLPARPRAAVDAAPPCLKVRCDDDDALSGRLRLPRRLRGAGPPRRRWPRSAPSTASASCTSPRPRSTRTSRTSSTAAARTSGPASAASSSPHRATSRATT